MIAQSGSRALMAGMIAALCVTPANAAVTISTAATSDMSCVSGVCTPTAADAVLNVGDLTGMLASGNVTVNTGTGSLPQQVEDIIVAAPFNWASANALTLDAYRSVTVDQPVADDGTGAVTLTTNDGGSGGNLSFMPGGSLSFLGTTNSLSINGAAYTLVDDIATLASDVTANPSGSYALAANYNATPDGTYTAAPVGTNFAGNFQGLGNTISNLTISNGTREAHLGLFAFAATSASILNVTLQDIAVRESANGSILGSLVGINEGVLFGGHSSGAITGQLSSAVGGLVGVNYGVVLNSSSSASVMSGKASTVGGLVGANDGSVINGGGVVSDCFATGQVSGAKSKVEVGGLVGDEAYGIISNSYAAGSVQEKAKAELGGFVGGYFGTTLSTSYSMSPVNGKSGDVGGFMGLFGAGTTSNNYWDTTTSGKKSGVGNDSNGVAGVTGLTSKKLQSGLPAGFDPTIWAESPSINNGLPYLIANPPQ